MSRVEAHPDLVRVADMAPRVVIDLRYATATNVTGRRLYGFSEAWLRRATAVKLSVAQRWLETRGLGLKLLDAYRPPSAQRALWAWCPDPRFVAPPERGSRHTRGTAVDVTLVEVGGVELEMPSAHDDFTERAHREWSGASEEARRHSAWLTEAMSAAGFAGIQSEWWHYDDTLWRESPLLDWEPGSVAGGEAG